MKIKPCPFCGCEAEVIVCEREKIECGYFGSDEAACVKCVQCNSQTSWFLHMPLAEVRVIQRWNTRCEEPSNDVVPAGNERLGKCD